MQFQNKYSNTYTLFQAPKEAYRPPCARGQNITFKLHDDIEMPSKSTECMCIYIYI